MEMGDPRLGCSSAEGLCPAPNTQGGGTRGLLPGPRGHTCSFTFTPSTVSTLF